MTTESRRGIGDKEAGPFSGIKGIGTIVLNKDGEILVGTEFVSESSRAEESGRLSIPSVRVKKNEIGNGEHGNTRLVYAALSRIVTDSSIDKVRKNLKKTPNELIAVLNPEGLQYGVFVFHWTGDPSEMPFEPSSPEEFTDFHWMSLEEFSRSRNARPYTSRILIQAAEKGFLNGSAASFTIPDISDYKPSLYAQYREMQSDVK